MKINKLFHWLYAALMCLPLLGVLFTSLYVTFNPNAKDSYSQLNGYSVNYKYQTNNVSSVDDLVVGNIYDLDLSTWDFSSMSDNVLVCNSNTIIFDIERYSQDIQNNILSLTEGKDLAIRINTTGFIDFLYIPYTSGSYRSANWTYLKDKMLTFVYSSDFNNDLISLVSSSTYNEISSVDINNEGSLDNVFSCAINDINNNPLYNWAQDSFLVAPIAFVTGLFGLTQTSPVVTLLSYWLTISIVWLVFDLIMYVPLLVHRWLDKGVIS